MKVADQCRHCARMFATLESGYRVAGSLVYTAGARMAAGWEERHIADAAGSEKVAGSSRMSAD